MMSLFGRVLVVAIMGGCLAAWGQAANPAPHVGYLYPAGGQQGTVTRVTAGGQLLRGAERVYVSGEGVHAKVLQYYKPIRNLQADQRRELIERLNRVKEMRLAEMRGAAPEPATKASDGGKGKVSPSANTKPKDDSKSNAAPDAAPSAAKKAPFQPVQHPLLYDLENKSLRELANIAYMAFFPRQKQQLNVQIAESVLIEVTVDAGAAPGDRELRLETPQGLTNPMVFQVGEYPETCELEPNDPGAATKLPAAPPVDVPFILNGQIMPGDTDRFSFRATKGQSLVIAVEARHLVPFLADAVPGWFQATVGIYDAHNREVAFADDYRFDPDPVLHFTVPKDGTYELEVHDAVYRGREDFVYRVSVSEQPFITSILPLGAETGATVFATLGGWNLAGNRLRLDSQADGPPIRQASLQQDSGVSNVVSYAVDTLPERAEVEPNDSVRIATSIQLPQIVNGTIGEPGDVDRFQFEGRQGDTFVAEIYARRLRSPLDSLLRLTDASGNVLAWNDDYTEVESGLNTHHADSYLRTQLPKTGTYLVSVTDSEQHGGEAFAYRLRLSAPQPDFALRMTPSSLNARAGRAIPITVYAFRKDGFDGEIEIALMNALPGFTLQGGRIPPGLDHIRMTITAPRQTFDEPVSLHLEGRARIADKTVTRPVVPAEDMMQAFIYRHLVPANELLALVRGGNARQPSIQVAAQVPVRIPVGGSVPVQIRTPKNPVLSQVQLALSEPPDGLTLNDVTVVDSGLRFSLKAEGEKIAAGFTDNLIVEAFTETSGGSGNTKSARQPRRVSLGYLPAIPFEIVPKDQQ